jgi:hypothetical protein
VRSLYPLTHSAHSPLPLPPPRSSPARHTSGSTDVGEFSSDFCLPFMFEFSFLFWERGGCLDCARCCHAVLSCSGAYFLYSARSFLQPRVLFSSAHARPCVDSGLASGMRKVCGPSVPHLPSRASFLSLGRCRFAARGPDARAFYLLDALRWGVPGPEPNVCAYEKGTSLGAILAR